MTARRDSGGGTKRNMVGRRETNKLAWCEWRNPCPLCTGKEGQHKGGSENLPIFNLLGTSQRADQPLLVDPFCLYILLRSFA